MSVRHLAIVSLALVAASVSSVLPALAASRPETVVESTVPIDPVVCKDLEDKVRAALATEEGRKQVSLAQLARARNMSQDGSDCTMKFTTIRQSASSAAYADTSCDSFYRTLQIWFGDFGQVGGSHTNVGMCWDGYTAWSNWGPNCYVEFYSGLFGGDITWCGVWNNGNWYTEPGNNFYIYVWPSFWDRRYGYMRFCVEGQGVYCNTWGGLN